MMECFSLVAWLLKSKSFAPERLRLGESHAEGTVMARGLYSSTVETHSAGEKQGWCQTDLWQASLSSLGRVVDHTITANKTVKKATTWTCRRWKLSVCSNNAGVLPPLVMEEGWVMLQHQAGERVVIFILIVYHMSWRYMYFYVFSFRIRSGWCIDQLSHGDLTVHIVSQVFVPRKSVFTTMHCIANVPV